MSGWTLVALLVGFILGISFGNVNVKKSLIRCVGAGAIVVNGIAYTVTPMEKDVNCCEKCNGSKWGGLRDERVKMCHHD